MNYWLDAIEGLPKVKAADLGWESVTLVGIHPPILSISISLLVIPAVSLPNVPMSYPFVERLIGSIRRELLDHTFFWTAIDLENKLREYQCYYNKSRDRWDDQAWL